MLPQYFVKSELRKTICPTESIISREILGLFQQIQFVHSLSNINFIIIMLL